jgi:uncharacterized repeat protein (TIGR01451 family)
MNKRKDRRQSTHLRALVLIGAFIIAVAVVALPFYSVRSSSLPMANPQLSHNSAKLSKKASRAVSGSAILTPSSSIFMPLLPMPQTVSESIATYDSTCVTPKSDFFLGDVVCAKATGVPVTLFPWRVLWVDPAGFVRQSNDASSDAATEYRYTIPSTATSTVNDQTVDNRGTWKVNLTRSNGAVRQTATFVVHEAANPVADVFIQKVVHSASSSVPSGDNISFTLVVGNGGPDPAAGVHLVDSIPAGGTLVQFTQNSGPQCAVVGDGPANDCTMAALTNGDRAEFTAVYNTGSATPGNYETSATVSSTTTDPNAGNNTSTAQYIVTTSNGNTTCQLICPDNINANADTTEGGQRGTHVTYDEPVTSGNCGSVSSLPASGSFFPVGTTVVNATSETGGGSCSFTVTVTDNNGTNPPTITCPANKTADANGDCEATVVLGTPTTSGDNVTVVGTRSDGKPMYNCDVNGNNCTRKNPDLPFSAGVTTVTWTATSHDSQGNETGNASCTQTVTVNDVTPPVITAVNSTVSADANCQAAVPDYSNDVSDNCACAADDNSQDCVGQHRITTTQDVPAGTMLGLGSHTIHLTANDGSSNNDGAGNTTEKDVTFTVNDTTAPTFTTTAADSSASADANCQAPVPDYVAASAASDNCGTPTLSQSPTAGTLVGAGPHTVTVTATDSAGNHTSDDVVFTVNDTTAPTVQAPADSSASADANCQAPVPDYTANSTASDNCDSSLTLTQSPTAGTLVGMGPHTVTVTATDDAGNHSSDDVVFTVNDTTPPTVQAPADSSASADANCQAPVPNYVSGTNASDNCDSSVTLTQSPAAGTMVGKGPHTVTVTGTDDSGNHSSDDVVFTVNDTTAPVITCPGDITRSNDSGVCSASINPGTATATDNCDTPTVSGTRSDNQPLNSPYPVGTTTITWTATDTSGNHSSCTQTITVNDTENPTISCPASQTLEPTCPSGAVATWTPPVGTDNCPGAVTTRTGPAPGSVFPIGTTTVTYSVTDAHGNGPVSCSFTITVKTVTQTIEDLKTRVNNSSLSPSNKGGLVSKLQSAEDALAAGHTNTACQKLADFINSTQNLINHGDISAAEGNAWISTAANIRNTIGCTNNPCT